MHSRPHWTHSILVRLLLVVFLALLPVIAVLLWTGLELRRTAGEQIIQEAGRALRAIGYQQQLVFENSEQLLRSLSIWPSIPERNHERLHELLAALVDRYETYATVVIVDTAGEVIASADPGESFPVAGRDYFRRVLDTQQFTVGSYATSLSKGLPVIPFAFPVVHGSGELDAVVVAFYRLDRYRRLIPEDIVPENWSVDVADRNGNYLFRHPQTDGESSGAVVDHWLIESLRRERRYEGTHDHRGTRYQLVAVSLAVDSDGAPDAHIIVRFPPGVVTPAVQRVVATVVAFSVVAIMFAALVTLTLGKWAIVNQLQRLIRVAVSLAGGDLASRSHSPHYRGELGLLAEAFDRMADSLQRRIAAEEHANRRLSESLMEKDVLLKEVHHRVKNNFQIILSLLRMQAAGIADPDARRQFRESENRIQSMALIHAKLYQSDSNTEIDFHDYIGTVIRSIKQTYDQRNASVAITIDAVPVSLSLERAVPLALIINELLTHVYKRGFSQADRAAVTVSLHSAGDGRLRLEVADTGREAVRNAQEPQEQSLGMQLIHALAAQLSAEIEFDYDSGTRFVCVFPG